MKRLRLAVFTLSALLLFGCKTNVNTMLDDYNSNFNFEAAPVVKQPVPGDIDFKEEDMLADTYCIGDHETINLAAPDNCNSWSWVVTDPFDLSVVYDENNNKFIEEKVIKVVFFDGSYVDDYKERLFVTYIPESGLSPGKTYKLTLTVTDKEGKAYKDICELVIYQHLEL